MTTKTGDWEFDHDKFNCMECRTPFDEFEDEHKLKVYRGTHDGMDARKYECTNPECKYVDIVTFDESGHKVGSSWK